MINAQDVICRVSKVVAVELGFRGAPGCLRGMWTYIGGRSRSVEQQGAHEGCWGYNYLSKLARRGRVMQRRLIVKEAQDPV